MAQTRHFNDAIAQNFPFKPPIMAYILDNNSHKHLYKFYQCCKLFPNKFPLNVIHEIQDITHIGQYVFRDNQPLPSNDVSKIWLSDKLELRDNNIRQWIPDIWICTIKCLCVRQELTLNEFKMLTQSENVENLAIEKVLDENGLPLSVEEMIVFVPKARDIWMRGSRVTPETFTKHAAMERKNKMSSFYLSEVIVHINPDELLRFIENHASKDCSSFCFDFCPSISEDETCKAVEDTKQ